MVTKNLSKSEYKYRYKFIYENHLNKTEQQLMDRLVQTYSELNYKMLYDIHNVAKLTSLALDEVEEKFAKLDEYGVSVDRAVQAFRQSAQQSAGIPACGVVI